MQDVKLPSLAEMLQAGVHFGHSKARWHPKMKQYLYGHRGDFHIIDLARSREKLAQAVEFIKGLCGRGEDVLFVGVKPLARKVVETEALRAGAPYIVNRWIGGTLTNWPSIKSMLKRMAKFEDDKAAGKLDKYTKFEQLVMEEEYDDLRLKVGGLRSLSKTPDALFVVDAKYDKTAVKEANKLNIPVVAITDSNINPVRIQHVIPGNDDALKSLSMITKVIADAVLAGKTAAAEKADKKEE